MTDELIEQVALAIGVGVKGPDFDPFDYPEAYEFACHLARGALAAINLPARLEAARTQGWNEAIEAAATIADHHRKARRAAHNEAHRRGAKRQATSALGRSLEAQQLMVAIRALTKENSDASSD